MTYETIERGLEHLALDIGLGTPTEIAELLAENGLTVQEQRRQDNE